MAGYYAVLAVLLFEHKSKSMKIQLFTCWIYIIFEFTSVFGIKSVVNIVCTLLLTGQPDWSISLGAKCKKKNSARLPKPLASHCHYRHVVHFRDVINFIRRQ